jgi:ABC-type antimicrobial peptide transport system permease subunit
MLKNYLKIAFRNLKKQKLYSFINIGGLALGMATAVLLTLWVYNEFTYDEYHEKSEDIYRVTSHLEINKDEVWHWGSTPLLLADKLTETYSEIEAATRLYFPWGDVNIKVNDDLLSIDKMLYVDSNWFEVFDYKFINGNVKSFKADKNNVAITESKAKEIFGANNPIGKVIQLDSINLVVKAVLADYPPNTVFKYDIYVQNGVRLANLETFKNESSWDNFNYQTYVVCNENTVTGKLAQKMTDMFREVREDDKQKNELKLQPLTAMHYDESIETGELSPSVDKKVLYIFGGLALLILITACINYINLTTANVSLRNKEVSIKKFMGISTHSLFFQFFIESALTSLLAMLLAVVLIYVGLPSLETVVDNHFDISENPLVWKILGATTLISILLNGIYPSLLLSNLKPLELIKGASVFGTKNSTFRRALVVFQFAFTIALIICTSLIFNQLEFIQDRDLGYDKEQVFSFYVPWNTDESGDKTDVIFNQLQKESQIAGITRSGGDIVNYENTHSGSLDWEGRDEDWKPTVSPMSVSNNYQDFFDLKLKAGRWFSADNAADKNNIILNEAAVKEFKLKEPIVGQKFTYQERTGQVIAVVKDFHFKSPREKITPLLFYRGAWLYTISVKADAKNISGAIATVERIWEATIPNSPFKYQFLDDSYDKLHRAEAKQLQLFYTFGGIVMLISCIGLFGLATFAAEVRIKEIGIRKILGASVSEIVNLLSKDFLKLIFVATILASPVAWWAMDKWLQNFAYRIDIEWWIFVIAGLVVALVALLTVSYQAIRAALLNPVETLKAE